MRADVRGAGGECRGVDAGRLTVAVGDRYSDRLDSVRSDQAYGTATEATAGHASADDALLRAELLARSTNKLSSLQLTS